MTSKQRAFLKGQAHDLQAVFQVGKQGITDELIEGIKQAIKTRELMKITVLEACPYNAKETANLISEKIENCFVVQTIGSKIVLFMQNGKESNFDLKKLIKIQ